LDVKEYIKDWEKVVPNLQDVKPIKGKFNSQNRAKTKDGFFTYPSHALTLKEAQETSIKQIEKMILVDDLFDVNLGKNYKAQIESVKDGIAGIVHWYLGQWIKTKTIVSNNSYISLKTIFIVDDKELYLGAFIQYSTRLTGHPHYSILGNLINCYIDWLLCKRNSDWEEADRLSACIFGFGYEMAKAENEQALITGRERQTEYHDSKKQQRLDDISNAKELIPFAKEKLKSKGKKITGVAVYGIIANELKVKPDTVKKYLKNIDINKI